MGLDRHDGGRNLSVEATLSIGEVRGRRVVSVEPQPLGPSNRSVGIKYCQFLGVNQYYL